MNIAIMGGKFDPPHIWHYWCAQQVLENVKGLHQVWYLPDYENAFKPILTPPENRVEMLLLMETGRIRLSTIAIAHATVTYTVNIVRELVKDQYNRFYWIVGS